MNQRERYLETLLFGTPDKIPLEPQSGLISTREAWYTQGLPKNIQHGDNPEYGYRQAGEHFPGQRTDQDFTFRSAWSRCLKKKL